MSVAEFIGIARWPDDHPTIDFETDSGIIDLHNNAKLARMQFSPEGVLVLEFIYAPDWRDLETGGNSVFLKFGGVKSLEILQASNYDPRAADSLEGIIHRVESDASHFEIDFGDIQCQLTAKSISIDATNIDH